MTDIDKVIEDLGKGLPVEMKLEDEPKTEVIAQRNEFQDKAQEVVYNLFREFISVNVGVHGAENAVLVAEKFLTTGEVGAFTSTKATRRYASLIDYDMMRRILEHYFGKTDLQEICRALVYEEILDKQANILNMVALATYEKYCKVGDDDQLAMALMRYVKDADSSMFTNDFGYRELLKKNIQDCEIKTVVGYAVDDEAVYNYGEATIVTDSELVAEYIRLLRSIKRDMGQTPSR